MSFTYNASALGLGGVFTRDGVTTIIPSQASVALAPTGGMGTSEVRNFSEGGVSFGYARSDVHGVSNGSNYTTVTNVLMTNLNVFGRLAADVIEASVVSQRNVENLEPDETEFTFGARFLGLRFDDETIAPRLDLAFLNDFPRYGLLTEELIRSYGVFKDRFRLPEDSTLLPLAAAKGKPIRCSMLDGADRVNRGVSTRHPDFVMEFENFGKVHLAEVLLKPGRRRVTLLRLDLNRAAARAAAREGDEPPEGSVTVGSVEGNGVPSWP